MDKGELEKLTSEEIKMFFTSENIEDYPNGVIKDYVLEGKPTFNMLE